MYLDHFGPILAISMAQERRKRCPAAGPGYHRRDHRDRRRRRDRRDRREAGRGILGDGETRWRWSSREKPGEISVDLSIMFHLYPLVNKHSCWKWPFIVSFPIKNGDVP